MCHGLLEKMTSFKFYFFVNGNSYSIIFSGITKDKALNLKRNLI